MCLLNKAPHLTVEEKENSQDGENDTVTDADRYM